MDVHYHFIKEKVLHDEIETQQIKTNEQMADVFTKALSSANFIDRLELISTCFTERRKSLLRGKFEKSTLNLHVRDFGNLTTRPSHMVF